MQRLIAIFPASPLVAEYIEQPKRLEQLLSHVLDRRTERAERRKLHIAELRKRAAEADAKLRRLYDAIENGVADLSDPMLKDRISELKATRDQARLDAERAEDAIEWAGPHHTASSQDVCQDSPQGNADRWRRLPPRSPSRARPTGRSRSERAAHHGIEKRAPAHARRSFKRKNGWFWRAQLCTELARPRGIEPMSQP